MQAQFQAAQASLDAGAFLHLLQRLDECIQYVGTNPQYADAGTYMVRFRQLQGRALGAVRNKVLHVLRHATQQVRAEAQVEGICSILPPGTCSRWDYARSMGCAASCPLGPAAGGHYASVCL